MPESLEAREAVADIYAGVLLSLAQASGTVEAVRAELESLRELEAADREFAAFMASHAIDSDRRAPSLEKMFRGRLSDMVVDALQVMNRNGRSDLVGPLARRYVVRMEEAAGQVEVCATTAVALDDGQREEVRRLAEQLSGKAAVMEFREDAALIGGLMLQIGDVRYDDSVRSRIEALRGQLAERGERGLVR
ncbi:MAG: ATP synthase subunit delta [Phycisphaerae bacterium]|nr:ATP synthase subunit delta [Phycisphaerae bacterium]